MPAGSIGLWWIGEGVPVNGLIEHARAHVAQAFGVPATLVRPPERPAGTLDVRRGQHRSASILKWLAAVRPPGTAKVLGVTDVDLFIPVLTFVFGEATLDGDVAVVSTARLAGDGGERYLASRLAKESIHEIGHTFGLIHCGDARCAMARSASLAHVDVKRAALCGDCRVRLHERQRRGDDGHGQ